ncbi:hypothetical protein [Flavobacterium sp. NKUCC04_CG]|uniref:hypothetical protein n=1 Tax=Flavobacterium sp. NKUCC04_CG TaxID=2842121 RepID=UPI001C5B60D9|nr:hypothetical protein [Flavobacterium sp. NKUCC04_CG]MBW3518417.1 hypothetical protein [Flavobacterium sp. NKUCC04_CG]
MNKINEKVNSSVLGSSLSLQFQELAKKSKLGIDSATIAALMPMSEILKTYEFNGLLESQKKTINSLSAFNSMTSIMQQITVPKIPDSTILALQGITSLQSMQYIDTLKSIQKATSILNFINPTLEINKIGNLNTAFNSLTSQLTQLASNNNDWEILEDYENFVNEAVEFSDSVIESNDEQLEISFELLLRKFNFYYEKHKQSASIIYKFFEILMMLTAMHQYYDFVQTKPELATKNDVEELKVAQQKTFEYVNKILSNKEKNVEEYKLLDKSEILLKPNKKSIIINNLPKNYLIEVLKKQPKWILIKYIDPKDGTPQMGWILRVNINFKNGSR